MYGKITSTLPVNKLYVPALVTQWVEIISEWALFIVMVFIVVEHKFIENKIREYVS